MTIGPAPMTRIEEMSVRFGMDAAKAPARQPPGALDVKVQRLGGAYRGNGSEGKGAEPRVGGRQSRD